MKKLIAVTLVTLTVSFAFAGGRDGGGVNKPLSSFCSENFDVLLNDPRVRNTLGFNSEIQLIQLVERNLPLHSYVVTSSGPAGTRPCKIQVDILNDHQTPKRKVVISNIRVMDGCSAQVSKSESFFERFAAELAQISPPPYDGQRPFESYLENARKIAPSRRKEMISFLQTSPEAAFHSVYSANGKVMADWVMQNPNASADDFYLYLGQTMNLQLPRNGIVPAVLIGMKVATLFILESLEN